MSKQKEKIWVESRKAETFAYYTKVLF